MPVAVPVAAPGGGLAAAVTAPQVAVFAEEEIRADPEAPGALAPDTFTVPVVFARALVIAERVAVPALVAKPAMVAVPALVAKPEVVAVPAFVAKPAMVAVPEFVE
jgi:hypothetical protein